MKKNKKKTVVSATFRKMKNFIISLSKITNQTASCMIFYENCSD